MLLLVRGCPQFCKAHTLKRRYSRYTATKCEASGDSDVVDGPEASCYTATTSHDRADVDVWKERIELLGLDSDEGMEVGSWGRT
jgi:hypothetical protein